MKASQLLLIVSVILTACTQSGKKYTLDHEAVQSDNPNQALYNEVMDIHDEIMPRMEDIYLLKKELLEKITTSTDLSEEKKEQLELVVAQLDSADHSMMEWMHKFNPLPDSADQEKSRAYLESEMEKIKTVREQMSESIENAKSEISPKKQ